MSKKHGGGKAARAARRQRRTGGRSWIAVTIALGVAAVAAVFVLSVNPASAVHPEPRSMEHTGHVVAAERYASAPGIEQAYRAAAEIPDVLDGIYCYCLCAEHSGHYSLLDCFASDHAAACDVCLSEAAIAHQGTQKAMTLRQVREAIDELYGAVM